MEKQYICDIIVPIYNAYEDFKLCIESLIKYTQNINYRLILIDDKSPDQRINEYLKELEATNDSRIIVLRNEENQGFVKTVNVGMRYSNSDVVLLNTDTVLTNNWLRKIVDCAYSDENIATVTPFTSKGVHCSVPDTFIDNEVPEGFTIDTFAKFIENISLKNYPEITTGAGFCMFIKRKVLDEVGIFDEEKFEKGYCEENDFCLRTFEKGYKNVLADDTYVYHKGTMSFDNDEKIKLSEVNLEKLHKIYPYYVIDKSDNLENIKFKNAVDNIKELYRFYKKDVKNILYIINTDYNQTEGEPEQNRLNLVINNKENNILTLNSNGKELILESYSRGELINTHTYRVDKPIKNYIFNDKSYYEIVESIVKVYNINLIHVQQFINHTFDIVDIAENNNIPIFMSLDDLYMVKIEDLSVNLLNNFKEKSENVLNRMNKMFLLSKDIEDAYKKAYNLINIEIIECENNNEEIVKKYNKCYSENYIKTEENINKSKYVKKILDSANEKEIGGKTLDYINRINTLENEINLVKNSLWWRIRCKFENKCNPLFKSCRKIVRTIFKK